MFKVHKNSRAYKNLAVGLLLVLVLAGFSMVSPAFANYLASTGIAAFDLKLGCRPFSLGGAFVARADDVSAALYNPAGLINTKGIGLDYANFATLSGSDNNLAALEVYPTGKGQALGLVIGKREFTDGTRQLTYSSSYIIGSYAARLSALPLLGQNGFTDSFSLGINVKAILQQSLRTSVLADQNSNGWDVDLGALWKVKDWINFGINAKSVLGAGILGGGRFAWTSGTVEAIPSSFTVGTSVKLLGNTAAPIYWRDNDLFINVDCKLMTEALSQRTFPALGVEWIHGNFLAVRFGAASTDTGTFSQLSLGVGFKPGAWEFNLGAVGGETYPYLLASCAYAPEDWKWATLGPRYSADPIRFYISKDEEVTYDETIVVSGEVADGARVFVNGQEAFVDSHKVFTVYFPLNKGKNLLDIKGDYFGQEIVRFDKKVLRKAKVVIAEEKTVDTKIEKLVMTEEKTLAERKEVLTEKLQLPDLSQEQKERLLAEKAALQQKEEKVKAEKEKLLKEKEKIEDRKEKVEALVTMGVVEVEPEKEFEMEAAVTRGELASWLVKAAALPLPQLAGPVFKDVPASHPMAPYIKVVVDLGIMQGFPDGTFRPEVGVTEEEGQALFKKFGVIM